MATRLFAASQQTSSIPRADTRRIADELSEVLRRVLNVSIALIGIVLTTPIMILIAVLIRLTSRGPILYTQLRVGLDRRSNRPTGYRGRSRDLGGKPFRIYKFRTMRTTTSASQVWARPNDARVTRIGHVLRRHRLDELPQLFNVLLGDMNIVGPRPEQPDIFATLSQNITQYARRQRVLPGITGLAQINLAYDQSLDDVRRKVEYDIEYIRRCSPIEDLRIMALTFPVMLNRRGAV